MTESDDIKRFNARKLAEEKIITPPQKQKVTIPSKTIHKKNQEHFTHLENL